MNKLFFALLLACLFWPLQGSAKIIDRIVAVVEEDVIMEEEKIGEKETVLEIEETAMIAEGPQASKTATEATGQTRGASMGRG